MSTSHYEILFVSFYTATRRVGLHVVSYVKMNIIANRTITVYVAYEGLN